MKTANSTKACIRNILRTRKNFTCTKLPLLIYQNLLPEKRKKKHVNQTTAIWIAIELTDD